MDKGVRVKTARNYLPVDEIGKRVIPVGTTCELIKYGERSSKEAGSVYIKIPERGYYWLPRYIFSHYDAVKLRPKKFA